MQKLEFQISKTSRLFEVGIVNQNTKYHWLCLHGYGQLGQYFVKPFEELQLEQHYFLAPEGLHRFYLNGTYGRVGASWMTKEDRLSDIEDNIKYLESVCQQFLVDNLAQSKLVAFAFSQGAATLVRWLEKTNVSPHAIIIWAGTFPEDVNYPSLKEKLSNTKVIYAIGDEDEYATPENRAKEEQFMKKITNHIIRVNFKGKHKIYPEVLKEVINKHLNH